MSYVNNMRMFVRVYELGNMSAAARDLRVSPAVASARIGELEKHLNIRLFNRTTRSLQPTEQGRIFYPGAVRVLEALEDAESAVQEVTLTPRGSIFVSAPLGIGRRVIAPLIPEFHEQYPDVNIRLRLSDRALDMTGEGLDIAFVLGNPPNSDYRIRNIINCPRVLCASPGYLEKHGMPANGADLINHNHSCLLLRFPGSNEFRWTLQTETGPQRFNITGPYGCDDGDVLTQWALAGWGIANKAMFDVAGHIKTGALVPVAKETPPLEAQLACLYPHKRNQDPKIRIFMDFMAQRIKSKLRNYDV